MESVSELLIVVIELVEVILDIFHCGISVGDALVREHSFGNYTVATTKVLRIPNYSQ